MIGELPGALVEALRSAPELALFLLLGMGYLIGNARLFGFQFGSTAGVLVVGLVMGHLGIGVPLNTQSIGFIFFIYCVGLEAGPQFFSAFREDGSRFLLLALFVAAIAVVTTVCLAQLLDFGAGYSAGLLAGALTSTPTLVAAQDAIDAGMADLAPGVSKAVAAGNLTASYAITYLYGLVGLAILVRLLPRILRIDLPSGAAKLARLRDSRDIRRCDRRGRRRHRGAYAVLHFERSQKRMLPRRLIVALGSVSSLKILLPRLVSWRISPATATPAINSRILLGVGCQPSLA
ncbi:MAG: hypothetical protein IH827_07740 [Myxococcales bacterium]|nr:hypothetical protein [Myxococcales bacterium]